MSLPTIPQNDNNFRYEINLVPNDNEKQNLLVERFTSIIAAAKYLAKYDFDASKIIKSEKYDPSDFGVEIVSIENGTARDWDYL